eukprot:TRINITY_DN33026_c7_g1_i1.p1 TRINITY_DN33026_c7_g1~~TRINITY_DN33026_c7_g1_i1.p1  ORF type:complete len:409 (-),score=96.28 TRINITY_DN33026_c7_g1_i1:261-1328(-)
MTDNINKDSENWGTKMEGVAVLSNDPSRVVPGCDLILNPLPGFGHEPYLKLIKEYIEPNAMIGAFPATGGFHWIAKSILGEDLEKKNLSIFGTALLPYNCRIDEIKKSVTLFGEKFEHPIAVNGDAKRVKDVLTEIWGGRYEFQLQSSFLPLIFTPTNLCIHPGRLYGLAKGPYGSKPMDRRILFYEEYDQISADACQKLSDELEIVSRSLNEYGINSSCVKWGRIRDYLHSIYKEDVVDPSTTLSLFRTNKHYAGIYAPQLPVEGGFVFNWKTRFLTEDLPFGLCLIKGCASILGIKTPFIDEVVSWGQGMIDKEYIVDETHLTGSDMNECPVPQQYGITTVEDLLESSKAHIA